MAKGKRGYKFTTTDVTVVTALIVVTSAMITPLPAITVALVQSPLPPPLSPTLRLQHFVDCCLPPQFLLLSATATVTVATPATADPVLVVVAVAVRHCNRHHWCQRFHCHHHQCCRCCLCFHQGWPLLLPLLPPPFPCMLQPPQTTTTISATVAATF